MTQTYPTPGYRTNTARAAAQGARGFQTTHPAARALQAALERARKAGAPRHHGAVPATRRTVIRPFPALSDADRGHLRNIALVLGVSARRHPWIRAADAAYRASRWLPDAIGWTQPVYTANPHLALTSLGWTFCGSCTGARTKQQATVGSVCGWGCFNLQAYQTTGFSALKDIGAPVTAGNRILTLGHLNTNPARWNWRAQYVKAGAAALPENWHMVLSQPAAAIQALPAEAPMAMPWALIPTIRNGPARQAGNQAPGSSKRPDGRVSKSRSSGKKHRKPGKRTHEKKFQLFPGGLPGKIVDAAFNAVEQVGIIHDALPDDCKASSNTAAAQFAAIYKCYKRIDGCKLVQGVMNDYIEDQIFGQLGRLGALGARSSGKAYGLSGASKKLAGLKRRSDGRVGYETTIPAIPKINLGC